MKITFTLLIVVSCAVGAYAQTNPVSGSISLTRPVVVLPDSARYYLVPIPSFGSSAVVKLDRFTGKTNIYEATRRKWFPLEVRGGLPASSTNTTPKYEIYPEFEPILINTETGQTWVLAERTWYPLPD